MSSESVMRLRVWYLGSRVRLLERPRQERRTYIARPCVPTGTRVVQILRAKGPLYRRDLRSALSRAQRAGLSGALQALLVAGAIYADDRGRYSLVRP